MVTSPPRRTWRERIGLAKAVPPMTEAGYTGQPNWGGELNLNADYVAAWQLPTRWTTVTKMVNDPDIAAALLAVQLPLLSVSTTVEPASDSAQDQEIAEFIARDLDNMTVSRQQHMAEVLDYIAWGSRIFETVYTRGDDGLYHLRKLALRPSDTISKWKVDEHGGPDGFTQRDQLGQDIDLPMDNVIVFTRNRRGGDLSGVSMLRPVYGPWVMKTELAKTGAVAVHRHGLGVPTIHYTGNSAAERTAYQDILAGIHAHEKAYVLLTNGVAGIDAFEFKGLSGSVIDPLPQLEYHRRAVYGAFLAQFLLLGQDTGSYALSTDHSSFFLMSLEALAAEVTDVYNRYLIPRWVGYNWPGVPHEALPKIAFGRLDRRDVTAWMAAVVAGIQSGVLPRTDELTAQATELLGLPAPEEAEPLQPEPTAVSDVNNPAAGTATAAPDTQGADGTATMARRQWTGATLTPPRLESAVKVEALGIPVAFDSMTEALDAAEKRMMDRLMAVQGKQAKAAAVALAAVLAKVAAGTADPEDLATVTIPYDASVEIIREELLDLYGTGTDQAAAEIEAQTDGKAERADKNGRAASALIIGVLAYEMAGRLADRLRTALGAEAVRQLGTGTVDRDALKAAADAAAKSAGKLTQDLGTQAASAALNTGRRETARANTATIEVEVYSAVMDTNTCEECAKLDGREYAIGEGPEAPNPECLGGARCRCIRIPVTRRTA